MENICAVNDHRGRGRSPSCQQNRGNLCYGACVPCRISRSHVLNCLYKVQANESSRAAESVFLDEVLHRLSFIVTR